MLAEGQVMQEGRSGSYGLALLRSGYPCDCEPSEGNCVTLRNRIYGAVGTLCFP